MILFENFTFHYGSAPEAALKGIDLRIDDGEFVLITGPSGGGKSSICRCLNGLIPHFHGGRISGRIEVQGMDPIHRSPRDMATKVGMVFQDPENQLVTMDVEREIAFGMENLGTPRNLIVRRVEESLDAIGIAHLRRRPIHELSGGEKQKVAIAAVLALHPEILVLDEPTSELDPKGAEEVLNTIQRLNDELGITVILIEHRLERVVHLVDRMIVIEGGKVTADGNPRHILGDSMMPGLAIGLPPIVRLVRGLDQSQSPIAQTPLTVKEARMLLDAVFRNSKVQLHRHLRHSNGNRTVLQIDRLWHAYATNVMALKNVTLEAREGDFLAVMGRNGSGKTTLAKHANGLLKPTKGTVSVTGTDSRSATVAQLAHKVGFVFQNPNDHLFADTVEEEIAFTLKNLGFARDDLRARVDDTLERFHLTDCRTRYPRTLSGGEKQRVALASILAAQPKILVLDEPTRGMDQRLKQELMAFLDEYRKQGNTVILISHDVETVAEHADRVLMLSEGKVIIDGSAREALSNALLFSPQINRLVQSFARYDIPGDILTAEEAIALLQ